MNLFDLTVALLAVLQGISGFREGLVRGLVKLAGFVLLVSALALFADPIARFARSIPDIPDILSVPLVFIGALVLGMIAFTLIGEVVSRMVHFTPLGFVDNGFGAAFGVLKAMLIAGILALILSFNPKGSFLYSQFVSSRTGPGLARFVTHAIPFVASAGTRLLNQFVPRGEPRGGATGSPDYAMHNSGSLTGTDRMILKRFYRSCAAATSSG
jgi:membrane protein required for colicin V production